jgi:preprotein translocase subunit SecD
LFSPAKISRTPKPNNQGNRNDVSLEFTDQGAKIFADLTAKNIGKHITILLDNQVLTNPVVQEAIPSGKAVITGQRTIEEGQHLAILLRSGALPASGHRRDAHRRTDPRPGLQG